MNSRYVVVDRENGNIYDGYKKTEREARELINKFQSEDINRGDYYPFRYKIVKVEEISNESGAVVGQREVFEGVIM